MRFAKRVAKAAAAARVVSDRTITRKRDGSVEIAYRVADADELVRWVLGWGAQAGDRRTAIRSRPHRGARPSIAAKYPS